ncbi:MAG: Hsp20/alpha crystallin family protein [Haloferacaceae archaeon]
MTDRDPFREIEELFERMNRELDGLGGQFDPALSGRDVNVDVAEHDDDLVVTADLPGFHTDDIEVAVDDGSLTIEADREETLEEEVSEDGPRYHRRERRRTAVSRRVRLPVEVDETEATAQYTNGVLTVTLPKLTAGDAGHEIEVE